jgi:hypothetical protein
MSTDKPNKHREPTHLAAGKAFHDLVQRFYLYEAEDIRGQGAEYRVDVKRGSRARRGRADVLQWITLDGFLSCVILEVKNTDWDRLAKRGTVRRNLNSHRRQVWRYLYGTTEFRHDEERKDVDLEDIDRVAGIVYPRVPGTEGLKEAIESYFGEWGITVVWFDEPPPEGTPAWEAWRAWKEGRLPSLKELRDRQKR